MTEVRVDIFDRSYLLRGDKSAAQLRKVAREVDYRMKEVAETSSRLDMTRVAVLVALLLAEDYLDLQERYDRVVQMLEEQYEKKRGSDQLVIPMRRGQSESPEEEKA